MWMLHMKSTIIVVGWCRGRICRASKQCQCRHEWRVVRCGCGQWEEESLRPGGGWGLCSSAGACWPRWRGPCTLLEMVTIVHLHNLIKYTPNKTNGKISIYVWRCFSKIIKTQTPKMKIDYVEFWNYLSLP